MFTVKRIFSLVIALLLCFVTLAEQSAADFLSERGMIALSADDLAKLGIDVGEVEKVEYKICALIETPDVGCFMIVCDGENEYFLVNLAELLTGGMSFRMGGTKQIFRDFCRAYSFDVYAYQNGDNYGLYIPTSSVRRSLNAEYGRDEYALYKSLNEFLGSF